MMKVFAGLIVLAALAMGAAMVVGGRVPVVVTRQPAIVPVVSPADTFVVHDAPPAAPAPAAPAPAPDSVTPGGLDAAIGRLRAAKSDPAAAPSPGPDATSSPDPLLAGPNPAPSILAGPPPVVPAAPPPPPPPSWTAVTSQGVRWRGAPNVLSIDMGGGRTATVLVDPAFQGLPRDAANERIDFLKQTILENFPRGTSQFRFGRDGSVAALR